MKWMPRSLILGIFAFALGCTKATPDFALLDLNAIPQPKFSGATTKTITTQSSSSTFSISGECDPKIKSISALAVGVASAFDSLASISSTAPTVQCAANGTFSFQLKSLTDLGFSPLTLGNTYEIQLKGMTSSGLSRASSIFIQYTNPLGNPNIRVTSGGIRGGGDTAMVACDSATGCSGAFTYKAEVHVNHNAGTDRGPANFPTDGTVILHPAGMAR